MAIAGLVISGLFTLIQLAIVGLAYWSIDAVTEETRVALNQSPTIQLHVGDIHSLDMLFVRSCTLPGDDSIYSIQGLKGSGVITVGEYDEYDRDGQLELTSGEKYDLRTGDPIP